MHFCIKSNETKYFSNTNDFAGDRDFGSFILEFIELDLHRLFQDCLNCSNPLFNTKKTKRKNEIVYTYDYVLKKHNSVFAKIVVDAFTNNLPPIDKPDYFDQINIDILNNARDKEFEGLTDEEEKMYILDLKSMYSVMSVPMGEDNFFWRALYDGLGILQTRFIDMFTDSDSSILYKVFSDLQTNLSVSFKLDDKNNIYTEYDTSDILTLLSLDLVNMISNNIKIKECLYCGKFFITSNNKGKYCPLHSASNNKKYAKSVSDMKRQKTPIERKHKNILDYMSNTHKFSPDEKNNFTDESLYYKKVVKGKNPTNENNYQANITSEKDYLDWLENKDAEIKASAKTRQPIY